MFWGSTLVALMMGLIASFVRVKASARPTNAKKILIPPLAMSTGMLQFLVPAFRLTWLEVGEALIVGLIFSVFLIKTSNFEKRDGEVYLSRSKAFFIVVFVLLAIRTVMKAFLGDEVNIFATGGLFYLIAWGMIVPWRIAMYQKYKQIVAS
ncbi:MULTISPECIES: cytochrome c biogenesis protein CcdC [Exiguobacterium]|uniref:Cytochrome c biogenesis protein CcdC n=1 Tax=Exiguobacterium mexicanum TaxID=340146 RepID=A0ABT7MPX2_9BACL|nr:MULTISPECIES: cytochrome c biogenesis protein CcdC [Exiguobacterium]KAB2860599.1 MAG: cytochrome c biogenesis protein CcdC [Exiguobacterium chiriqhucha]MDL5377201.1 cytochrome c biogenesis protein CcdC [Exiguobacterium mexicanum]TCI72805.1 cytochrome c biogenesis protein CcdC [Exiguobacterium sp. IPCI3]TCI82204.1 cytochrome c biogenesis protein CcdC [Exiguobacterium sp. IPCH1]TCI83710.1 cytochrome c biogenesis protein CcdC [Exiguobacterium sp. IPBC4]